MVRKIKWTIRALNDLHGILSGKIRRTWPREGKYEVVGISLDRRPIGIICRITGTGKVRVITVYEDKPKGK